MKKIILIILSALLFYNVNGQKRDYDYYNRQIDRLIAAYSIDKAISTSEEDKFFTSNDENLTTNEKKKIISKIKKIFEQQTYTNLYYLGHTMLYNMYFYQRENNSPEIRQILIELYLRYYFYPGRGYSMANSYNLESRFDYTTKAKKRIVEILEDKKTKEEYILYFTYWRTYYNDPKRGWEEAAIIMKTREERNATALKQLRDSIIENYVAKYVKREFEAARIEPDLIKMIGLLEMKECIPTLKQKLAEYIKNGSYYSDEEEACRYALARLGDEEQRQYILATMNINNFSREDFQYFQDDEIIWRYIDVSYLPGERIAVLSDDYLDASLLAMNDVYPFVKNVPQELMCPTEYNVKIGCQWAKAFYEWLMENREKIEFDYEGEKKWFWPHY
jgi:hypothetical protein